MLEYAARGSASAWIDRRDPRFKVLVRVSLRGSGMPVDACVRDVSRRGLLLLANNPPERGSIVEVIGPFPPVVGRVVWASERRFGVATQGCIRIADFLIGKAEEPVDCPSRESGVRVGATTRRQSHDRSCVIGRLLQFSAIAIGGAVLAIALAQSVYGFLADVAGSIEMGL